MPPTYSDAVLRDSSLNSTAQLSVGGMRWGGAFTWVSIQLMRIPRRHSRLDLRQFWQLGAPSSHLRWRSLQVRQPVRVLVDLVDLVAFWAGGRVSSAWLVASGWARSSVASAMLVACEACRARAMVLVMAGKAGLDPTLDPKNAWRGLWAASFAPEEQGAVSFKQTLQGRSRESPGAQGFRGGERAPAWGLGERLPSQQSSSALAASGRRAARPSPCRPSVSRGCWCRSWCRLLWQALRDVDVR